MEWRKHFGVKMMINYELRDLNKIILRDTMYQYCRNKRCTDCTMNCDGEVCLFGQIEEKINASNLPNISDKQIAMLINNICNGRCNDCFLNIEGESCYGVKILIRILNKGIHDD